jgi:hypothetical protein
VPGRAGEGQVFTAHFAANFGESNPFDKVCD